MVLCMFFLPPGTGENVEGHGDEKTSNLPPPSHNLGYLMSQTGIAYPPEIETAVLRVSPHYINSRYPDSAGGRPSLNYNEAIAREILKSAEKILKGIL